MNLDENAIREYQSSLFKKLGLSHAEGSWEDEWIEGSGVRLYAPVFSAGEGKPTVVFIPGTSVYALCYVELLYGLQRAGINVVGFDPRGQGRSGGERGDYTIMEHVADARAAIAYSRKRFGGPVLVMGSSQGGIEAFYLAAAGEDLAGCICHNIADLTDPESVRLTRFGSKQKAPPALVSKLMGGAGAVLKGLAAVTPLMRVPIAAYLDLSTEPMRVFGNAWNFLLQDPLALKSITMRAVISLATTELPRPIAEIETPILVLHSTGDNIFPEDYVMRLYDMLTCNKEIKNYQGLPHLITIEHVDEILPDVVEWIKRRVASRR